MELHLTLCPKKSHCGLSAAYNKDTWVALLASTKWILFKEENVGKWRCWFSEWYLGREWKSRIRCKLIKNPMLDSWSEGRGKEEGTIGGNYLLNFLLASYISLQYHSLCMTTTLLYSARFERWCWIILNVKDRLHQNITAVSILLFYKVHDLVQSKYLFLRYWPIAFL